MVERILTYTRGALTVLLFIGATIWVIVTLLAALSVELAAGIATPAAAGLTPVLSGLLAVDKIDNWWRRRAAMIALRRATDEMASRRLVVHGR